MPFSLLLALVCVFPRGSAEDPGVIAPLVPQGKPVAFWWDETAFHVGDRAYGWGELGAKPADGATFRLPLGEFERQPIVLEATLDSSSHKVRIASTGPVGGNEIAFSAETVAGYDDSLRCQFFAEGQAPNYLDVVRTGSPKKGEKSSFALKGRTSLSGTVMIELTGGPSPALTMKGGDDMQTAGVTSLKRVLYRASARYHREGLPFDYQYVDTDREKKVMRIVTRNWSEPIGGGALRVTAKDLRDMSKDSGWSKTLPLPPGWETENDLAFDVSDLKSGFHWMMLEYLDKSGTVVGTDRFRYYRPGETEPWDGTTLGASDTVPPPWTDPVFGKDGTFACWSSVIKLGGKGLVSSVVTRGKEMLTEPIAVLLNGRPVEFDAKLVTAKKASAIYRLTARRAPIVVDAACDFDGYVRFALTYGKGVSTLAWRVSLDRAHVKAFDDGRSNNDQDWLGGGAKLERSYNWRESPYWWAGGLRGLCGGLCSYRGTRMKELGKAVHAVAGDKAMTVTMNLVDTPYDGAEERKVRFYIEPTPMHAKDMDLATRPMSDLVGWTGHLCEHFETKYPGFEVPEKFQKFRDMIRKGKRVFWYNATHALSPDCPFWGWYGSEWMKYNNPREYCREVPLPDYPETKKGRWTYSCCNSRSYLESKLWGIHWYMNEPAPEAKDLYFDVCNPGECFNANHGCVWTDDFGRAVREHDFETTRELHKRAYRMVKAKNQDGQMFGHLTRCRKPTDAFFSFCCMGEFLAWRVRWQDSYYDIFTPEFMQRLYVPRAADMLISADAQFHRWRECWAPDLLENYDPSEPKLDRAIRHFIAYARIHDVASELKEWQIARVENALATLGKERTFESYYTDGEKTVSLSAPGPRQLWARYDGNGKTMLILLNDTDAPVTETVTAKGVKAVGKDVVDKKNLTFDFTSGSCTVVLEPRQSFFMLFD